MLKTEPFPFNGETTTIYELSALNRIEFLEYLAEQEKTIPAEGTDATLRNAAISAFSIREASRVVAMSLQNADRKGPTVNEVQQDVLETWSLDAIIAASFAIKVLSGIIKPQIVETTDTDDTAAETQSTEETEPVTAEKP